MANPILTATVKATGQKVQVYKLTKGGYANYIDPKISYKDDELQFN